MKKRLLSMLLALVLVLTMLPMSVLAEEIELFGEEPVVAEHAHFDESGNEDGSANGVCDYAGCTACMHETNGDIHDADCFHAAKCTCWTDSEAGHKHVDTAGAVDGGPNGTCDVLGCTVHMCKEGADGFCEFDDSCTRPGACLHEVNGKYCAVENCAHPAGCLGCNGAKPKETEPHAKPAKPVLSEIMKNMKVVVNCSHPDHGEKEYGYLDGGVELGEISLVAGEWVCVADVVDSIYVAAYNEDVHPGHSRSDRERLAVLLTYDDDVSAWNTSEDVVFEIALNCAPPESFVTYHTIYPEAGKHGTVSSEGWPVYVEEGDDVTFWFYPDKGYEVSAVYVDGLLVNYYGLCYDHYWDCDGCEDCWWVDWSEWYDCDDPWCDHWHDHWYDCDDWCGHRYVDCDWSDWQDSITFYDVDANHDLYVEFAPIDSGCPSDYYYDLNTEAWYHEATDFVIANDIMKGVGGKYFDPNGTTTRGQLVTMLYRLAGEPKVSGGSEFLDVADGKWYTDAVIWAARKGIVDGYGNGYFGVFDTVTREQTVTILYRYAKYMGVSVSKLADLKYFIDAKDVSDFAEEPFGWAVKRDIIEGKAVSGGSLKLDPQGATARVEMAAMLMRFAEYVD